MQSTMIIHELICCINVLNTKLKIIRFISLSLSTIVTVAWLGLPTLTLLGNEETLISICISSLFSKMLSSIIVILNEAVVTPIGNETVDGPKI